jgi:hypothetical protein
MEYVVIAALPGNTRHRDHRGHRMMEFPVVVKKIVTESIQSIFSTS